MDRRGILAIGICFLILLFYPYFLKWMYPTTPKTGQALSPVPVSPEAPVPDAKIPPAASPSQLPAQIPKAELLPKYDVPEEEFVVENNQMRVVLSNWGGDIRDIGLKYFHDKQGDMVHLGTGAGQGWKTLQLLNIPGAGDGVYKGAIEGKKVVFESTGQTPLFVRKTYVFAEDGYQIHVSLQIENKSQQDVVFENGLGVAVGSIFAHEPKAGLADVSIAALDNLGNVWRKNAGRIRESALELGSFRWTGLQNQYYAIIVKSDVEAQGITFAPTVDARSKVQGCQVALWHSKFKILPGDIFSEKFILYNGPKEYFQLAKFPDQFQKIIDFGMFGPIGKGILYLLHYLYKPFHSYGIAIILLTALIKIITYPLTAVSFKSMKKMQALAPHVAAVKEKHKSNPKKMQKEMMDLYKEHKVNPMGGCLPMLIQLPIFVALYTALRGAIELKGSSFLWIKDLSLPDTVAEVAGLPINILPIIMGGTMVWQQKMSTVDPQQAKMMMFMPIFFTFIFYSFPSGLVLYWLVNNVLSIIQQYQVQRQKT